MPGATIEHSLSRHSLGSEPMVSASLAQPDTPRLWLAGCWRIMLSAVYGSIQHSHESLHFWKRLATDQHAVRESSSRSILLLPSEILVNDTYIIILFCLYLRPVSTGHFVSPIQGQVSTAQDKCHHYCKSENAEKNRLWNTRGKQSLPLLLKKYIWRINHIYTSQVVFVVCCGEPGNWVPWI